MMIIQTKHEYLMAVENVSLVNETFVNKTLVNKTLVAEIFFRVKSTSC